MKKNLIIKEIDRKNVLLRLKHLEDYLNWYDSTTRRFNLEVFIDDLQLYERCLYRLEVLVIKEIGNE